jgi:hypothetical protein
MILTTNTVKPAARDDSPRKKSVLLADSLKPFAFGTFPTRTDAPKPGPARRMFSSQLRDIEGAKKHAAVVAERKAAPVPVKKSPGRKPKTPVGVKRG